MISISTDKNKVIIEGCLELLKKHREGHIVINPAYMLAMTPMMGREPSVAILKDTVCRGLFTQDGVQYSVKVTERELPDGTAYILQCYPDSNGIKYGLEYSDDDSEIHAIPNPEDF